MPPEAEEPMPPETEASKTRKELAAKFEELAARARAAGISPLQVMAQTYIKRGMAVIDSVLSALEEAPKEPPAGTEKKA